MRYFNDYKYPRQRKLREQSWLAPVDHGNKEGEEEEDSHSQLSVYYNSINGLNGAGLTRHRMDEALTKAPSFEGAPRRPATNRFGQ